MILLYFIGTIWFKKNYSSNVKLSTNESAVPVELSRGNIVSQNKFYLKCFYFLLLVKYTIIINLSTI